MAFGARAGKHCKEDFEAFGKKTMKDKNQS